MLDVCNKVGTSPVSTSPASGQGGDPDSHTPARSRLPGSVGRAETASTTWVAPGCDQREHGHYCGC
jgi:hypothetical protein